MIRINLLAVDRERTKRARADSARRSASRSRASLILIVDRCSASAGGSGRCTRRRSALDDDIAKGERETQQLRSVLAQVQKFEASKAQLQQRVTLIEQLRRGQSGPVHILDEISKAVPERLWLTDMTQKGDDIVLAGMTTSLTGLSDFVANLEGSAWFKKPVDIVDSQVMSDREERATSSSSRSRPCSTTRTRHRRRRQRRRPAAGAVRLRRRSRQLEAESDFQIRTRNPWKFRSANFRGTPRSARSSSSAVLAVFGFWKFYVADLQADIDARQTRLTALKADIAKGVATARRLPQFQSDVAELERRLDNLRAVLPEQKDVADILRRVQGLATQSSLNIQRFTPQEPKQEAMYASLPFKLTAEGTLQQPGPVLRSHQQVPANHQRRRDHDQAAPGAGRDREHRSRMRRDDVRAAGKQGRRRPADAAADAGSCRSSRQAK